MMITTAHGACTQITTGNRQPDFCFKSSQFVTSDCREAQNRRRGYRRARGPGYKLTHLRNIPGALSPSGYISYHIGVGAIAGVNIQGKANRLAIFDRSRTPLHPSGSLPWFYVAKRGAEPHDSDHNTESSAATWGVRMFHSNPKIKRGGIHSRPRGVAHSLMTISRRLAVLLQLAEYSRSLRLAQAVYQTRWTWKVSMPGPLTLNARGSSTRPYIEVK
ncbi:hypothetical protein C8Q79DRAFT_790323 [Trametes meyenii]|nr:hypothetical protein C8Q79DRAFT_790323 [Trametes meyenii]